MHFGRQLNVPDAPDVAGDAGALVLFNAQVPEDLEQRQDRQQEEEVQPHHANCGGAGDWTSTSQPAGVLTTPRRDVDTDTDTYSQDCAEVPLRNRVECMRAERGGLRAAPFFAERMRDRCGG